MRSNGEIKWQGELVLIGAALVNEVIGLRENADGEAAAYFGPIALGVIDGVTFKLNRGAQ